MKNNSIVVEDRDIIASVISHDLRTIIPKEPDKFMMNCFAGMMSIDYKRTLVEIKLIEADEREAIVFREMIQELTRLYNESKAKLENMISKKEGYIYNNY